MWCEIKLCFEFLTQKMASQAGQNAVIRYRGFLLLEQPNQSWLVRPERSPMVVLPFRTHVCSISEVKKILDRRLSKQTTLRAAA